MSFIRKPKKTALELFFWTGSALALVFIALTAWGSTSQTGAGTYAIGLFLMPLYLLFPFAFIMGGAAGILLSIDDQKITKPALFIPGCVLLLGGIAYIASYLTS